MCLEAKLWGRVEALAQAHDVPPVMVAFAAYAVLLDRLSDDRPDCYVELPVLGHSDFEKFNQRRGYLRVVPRFDPQSDLLTCARSAWASSACVDGAAAESAGRAAQACLSVRGKVSKKQPVASGVISSDGKQRSADNACEWAFSLTLDLPKANRDGEIIVAGTEVSRIPARASGFLDAFVAVLENFATKPSAKLPEIEVARHFDQALTWPKTQSLETSALASTPRSLSSLFDAIVAKWPDDVAVVWASGRLSFSELDAAAVEIAAMLGKFGGQRGDVVAFRLEESLSGADLALYLAVQIACLRANFPLLPLAQQLPVARARAQVEDLGCRFILGGAEKIDCAGASELTLRSDAIGGKLAATVCLRPPTRSVLGERARDVAILFTSSGTTGVPKTILVSQEMLLGVLESVAAMGVIPALPSLMGPNVGFDVSIADVWVPWIFGKHVVVLDSQRRMGAALAQAHDLGARVLSLSATLAAAALGESAEAFKGYDTLVMTGEALPFAVAQRFEKSLPYLKILNAYGPTETAIWATIWDVKTTGETTIPIGRAVSNYRIFVADDGLRPLPAHWPGELLIASAGPCLGYLDPSLTLTRFVELPRAERGPFFRTGDYGWIDDKGQVRFLGRRDRQTKIRGVRIEIDGIEHRVAEVGGVVDVGVVVLGQSPDAQIVAVVQPRPGYADLEPLRVAILENCRRWLQRAEVPSLVLFTETMPVGQSGKKSYTALAEAVSGWLAQRANEAAASAPEIEPGSVEAKLLALWMEVLNVTETRVSKVGVNDDLFLLGATSLDAIIAAERIATLFGVTCHENEVMLRPTLAGQAAFLRETQISSALARARSKKREGVGIRLVRKATGPGKSRGAILGMPLIGGDAHYVGSFAAHALSQYDIWAAETNLHGRNMLDEEMWLPVAQEIAGRLLGDVGVAPKGLIGFSIGGFMSWLVDRIMVAAGRSPARLINLDGSIPVN